MIEDAELIRPFLEGLRPEPRFTVVEWAEKYRFLSSQASSEPGLYSAKRTPYLRKIMEKLSVKDPCQKVVFMKGAQVGATEAGNNWLGYIIDLAPGPAMMVMPTDDSVKRNSKIRIDPMIESTPRLLEKIGKIRTKDSSNTTRMKEFPGGVLVMTGANSAVGLRSMPVRFLMLDEVDGYPTDLDGEGDPIELAIKRTATFSRRKVYIVSTPTIEGQSAITSEFEGTDQNYYNVPCPHCGTYQKLEFERLLWDEGKPETVVYLCSSCEEPIKEGLHKTAMLEAGDWVPEKPENASPKKIGFHLNALYSPLGWYSWAEAAADFEESQRKPEKRKSFYNTVLGLPYKENGEAPDWQRIYERAEGYPDNYIDASVAFLTAGADVQGNRIECEVVGWCRDKRSFSVTYEVIHGDTSKQETWAKFEEFISKKWLRHDGLEMGLKMVGVDTGFNTHHVYEFCRKHGPTKVIALKGSESLDVPFTSPRLVDVKRDGKKTGETYLIQAGVSYLKEQLYGYLKQSVNEDGTYPWGYCHFQRYDPHYFKGLTGERRQMVKNKRGYLKPQWVKTYERNEPLDCRVYAMAAAAYFGIDRMQPEHFEQIMQSYGFAAKEKPKPKRPTEDYWSRW